MKTTVAVSSMSLGSTLLNLERNTRKRNGKVSLGCEKVDRTLHGGLGFGEVNTIAASDANTRSILSCHIIVNHLLKCPHDEAVMIDTTGSFSVHTLRDVAIAKLEKEAKVGISDHEGTEQKEYAPEVLKDISTLLDRVSIVRAFDFTGLMETIGDVNAICRDATRPVSPAMRDYQSTGSVEVGNNKEQEGEASLSLIIIDDIAAVLQPILNKSNVEAQALLTALHRILLRLVQMHQVCAILFNGIVGTTRADFLSPNGGEGSENSHNTSISNSIHGRPALGKTFLHLADLVLMISPFLGEKAGVEVAHGGSTSQKSSAGWEDVSLVEVIKDRYGHRQDKFALFRCFGSWLERVGH